MTDQRCAEFTVYINKSISLKLPDDLTSCSYYSYLNDGSTGSSVTEKKVIYVLFLKEGIPTCKYLSIEPVEITDAPRILQSSNDTFERIRNKSLTNKAVGSNVDGASVILGKHRRVGKLVQEKATWLQFIHFFNHRVELTLKGNCF